MTSHAHATDAIVIDGVSKTFRVATEPSSSLKERLLRLARLRRTALTEFQALRHIDLAVPMGQTLGILGHNGSGKSTLLKCIAGIITPSTGTVGVRGRLTSLLELGAGFHPDLTGRENVYINAAFYGLGRRDVDKVFDEIVEFAEMARFIDEPVKHYSSGMYVRLGFGVAVNLDPDVLLVDEVLAVGDEMFQTKCLSRIRQFQDEGRTIVFVTHDAETVRRICDRAVVLHRGEAVFDGDPAHAIRVVRERLHGASEEASAATSIDRAIAAVRVRHAHQAERRHLLPGEALTIEVDLRPREPITKAVLDLELGDRLGRSIYRVDTDGLAASLGRVDRERTVRFTIRNVWLLDGEFPISLRLADQASGEIIDWRESVTTFEVEAPGRADGTVALDVTVE